MRYLTAEEIMAIHQRILENSGGWAGVRDQGLLFSVAERPKTTLMGQEMFADVFAKSASYLEALATYHVLTDGNKRTALVVTAIFLRANGYSLSAPDDGTVAFMVDVAQQKKEFKEIIAWLKKNSR